MLHVNGGTDTVLIGTDTTDDGWFNADGTFVPGFMTFGNGNTDGRLSAFVNNQADSGGPMVCLGKTRATAPETYTIVQDDDQLGIISFQGGDGVTFVEGASIRSDVDGTPGENDMPGRLEFFTTADGAASGTERMRIEEDGNISIGASGTSSQLSVNQSANNVGSATLVTNASYSNHMNYWQIGRAGATAFNFLICISNVDSSNDTEFRIQGSGATQSDGSYDGTGVDFGEYFEWADGNSSGEVRYGYSVVLDGNKIRKATAEDTTSDIIGIISAHPTVIGDADIDRWNKKYLRDDFNKSIMEEYTVTTWTEKTYLEDGAARPTENVSYPTDAIPSDVTVPSEDVKDSEGRIIKTKAVVITTEEDGVTKLTRKKLNPDWDSSLTYIPRGERKEWDVVGLVGKLRMHKGQPTNPNWRKMRDISDTVEEWLVR
jgi:hypothetical protein